MNVTIYWISPAPQRNSTTITILMKNQPIFALIADDKTSPRLWIRDLFQQKVMYYLDHICTAVSTTPLWWRLIENNVDRPLILVPFCIRQKLQGKPLIREKKYPPLLWNWNDYFLSMTAVKQSLLSFEFHPTRSLNSLG